MIIFMCTAFGFCFARSTQTAVCPLTKTITILIIRVLYLFEPHLNTTIFSFFVLQEVQTPTFEIFVPLVTFVCAIISSVSVPACRTCSHLCSFGTHCSTIGWTLCGTISRTPSGLLLQRKWYWLLALLKHQNYIIIIFFK